MSFRTNPRPANPRPFGVRDLVPGHVYLAPSGKLVRLLPTPERGMGSGGELFEFRYLGEDGSFWLRESNVRFMRAAG